MNDCCMKLHVPLMNTYIEPGCKIRLGRFDHCLWTVQHGWYTVGGNRPVCGWYLTSCDNAVRPIQLTDLDDIYIIE